MIFEGVEKALEPQTFTSPKVSQNRGRDDAQDKALGEVTYNPVSRNFGNKATRSVGYPQSAGAELVRRNRMTQENAPPSVHALSWFGKALARAD